MADLKKEKRFISLFYKFCFFLKRTIARTQVKSVIPLLPQHDFILCFLQEKHIFEDYIQYRYEIG